MKLKALTTAVRRIEQHLSPNDDWASELREIAYKRAQSVLTPLIGVQFTREKGRADYITTVKADVDAVETALWKAEYQRNMLSTWKYRVVDGERQDIVSAWVYDQPYTDTQHDVYLFSNDDAVGSVEPTVNSENIFSEKGTVDVYGHREPSVRNPTEHLDLSTGISGDPNGRARAALAEAGIKTTTTYTKQ